MLTDEMNGQRFYSGTRADLKPGDRFYHGTRADLAPGDLIKPGHPANFGKLAYSPCVALRCTIT